MDEKLEKSDGTERIGTCGTEQRTESARRAESASSMNNSETAATTRETPEKQRGGEKESEKNQRREGNETNITNGGHHKAYFTGITINYCSNITIIRRGL